MIRRLLPRFMLQRKWPLWAGCLLALALVLGQGRPGQADPATPGRQETLLVTITHYEWWLTDWQTNQVICQIFIEHQGLPSHPEVLTSCGHSRYQEWVQTPPCQESVADQSKCKGVYLHLHSQSSSRGPITVQLPGASALVRLSGCQPELPTNYCEELPSLLIDGREPLPRYQIVAVRGTVDGVLFSCPGSACEVPLRTTRPEGAHIAFRAESSFGDYSPWYEARVRVVAATDQRGNEIGWFVDVLSSQWTGSPPPTCSRGWNVFPAPGGPPAWLQSPETVEAMVSNVPYAYLSGILIEQGWVNASHCPGAGLLASGAANPCGLEAAEPEVQLWQNQFDELILRVARKTGVPAQLMKNLFARESQFWPGIFDDLEEVGLGQLTENGADTTLLWNQSFFGEFCPLVLTPGTCAKGYAGLLPGEQALLRGALVGRANAACESCPLGVDLTAAEFSVSVFAETLLAGCEQVGHMVTNTTGVRAGDVSSYADLWRMTLANYNAGPGCLASALEEAWEGEARLDWETVAGNFSEACEETVEYVDDITR